MKKMGETPSFGLPAVIEARNLSKRYGETLAVDDLSFRVEPAQVTGFLGPNGSGKSTTMRLIVGLDSPTSGAVTVGGHTYRSLRFPLKASSRSDRTDGPPMVGSSDSTQSPPLGGTQPRQFMFELPFLL
jgi:ABC-type glutathione transport system ATPase component